MEIGYQQGLVKRSSRSDVKRLKASKRWVHTDRSHMLGTGSVNTRKRLVAPKRA